MQAEILRRRAAEHRARWEAMNHTSGQYNRYNYNLSNFHLGRAYRPWKRASLASPKKPLRQADATLIAHARGTKDHIVPRHIIFTSVVIYCVRYSVWSTTHCMPEATRNVLTLLRRLHLRFTATSTTSTSFISHPAPSFQHLTSNSPYSNHQVRYTLAYTP